jgi:DNA-binding NarL/FixJ family response regulator
MSLSAYANCIRVVIADDHSFLRQAFSSFLNTIDHVKVVGQAGNGLDLCTLVESELPDLVVTDVKMPGLNGIKATQYIKKKFPEIKVICFTMHMDDQLVAQMLEAGVEGYLLKSINEDEIIEAINTIYNGGVHYCYDTSKRIVQMMVKKKVNPFRLNSKSALSEKEIQIMTLICEQYSNKEIAAKMNLSSRSVESCRERLQEKIGARNMAGIVTYAIRNRIYNIDE